MGVDYETLIERMLAGDRVALGKLISLVADRSCDMPRIMSRLHDRYGKAYVLGFTGPPGAGKSTLVDRVIARFRSAGSKVGVVAVDPSSPFSGGALLGDRIRMQRHYGDEGVFIRSLSARGSVGGLTPAARDVARVLDASGKDVVIVETVGVGQSEFDIMGLADTVVVVLVPEAGDTIQAMKAGLLEIADVFVVNKSDREGAARIKAELEQMLQLGADRPWRAPVVLTAARDDRGIEELMEAVARHRTFLRESGEGERRSAAARIDEFLITLREEIARRIREGIKGGALGSIHAQVEGGKIDPYAAALRVVEDEKLLAAILGGDGKQE